VQKESLPRLDIVPLRRLILHEDVESYRVQGIMERLRGDRALKNPPIVGQTRDHKRLIVLDGASRVTAARRLGFPHLLVQIVPYPSSTIGLDPWHHLVVGMSLEDLETRAARIPGAVLEQMRWSEASRALDKQKALACLRSPGKRTVTLRLADLSRTGLRPIRELTHLYVTDPGLHRVREDLVAFPEEWLGDEWVLVVFPRFRQEDIVRIALRHEDRLPMGVTRHTVPNRALRVFYPVSRLRASRPLRDKRRHLQGFLEEKWERGQIRHYPEPTTLYEE
jgi:hypothetical protein